MNQIGQDVLESSPLESNNSRNPRTEYDSISIQEHLDALELLKACSQEIYSLFGYSKGAWLLYLHSVTLARGLSQQRQTILRLSVTHRGDRTCLT